jgi:hypothetical protein
MTTLMQVSTLLLQVSPSLQMRPELLVANILPFQCGLLLPATRRPPELQPLELRDETERLMFRCVPTLQLLVCHPPPAPPP